MAYIPAWQRLSDAIENVMMGVGRSREEAQSDICRAIADRTVKIQGKLKKHTTRVVTSTRVLEGKDFEIPAEIKPTALDWETSCPVNPWQVHRAVFGLPGYWELEWIKLFRTDVLEILCTPGERGGLAEPASSKTGVKSRSRPTRERAQRVIHEVFPQGVPGPADLPNAVLCRRVGKKLKEQGLADVSDDTILRVAGRRRK